MDGKKINAIVLQGINHNLDKISVEDGMCEDLINLRYKDGSWRTTGEGKLVFEFGDESYCNMFVHTNVYRHVIGSKKYEKSEGETVWGLYWFADIDSDGNFTLLNTPVLLNGDSASSEYIHAQTGHLLVLLQQNLRLTLFFNRATSIYDEQERLNGEDGALSPFGNIQYKIKNRLDEVTGDPQIVYSETKARAMDGVPGDEKSSLAWNSAKYNSSTSKNEVIAGYNNVIAAMKHENSFHGAFLICLALKLYSGDWVFATSPTLICPSYEGDNEDLSRTKVSLTEYVSSSFTNRFIGKDCSTPIYVITKGMQDETRKQDYPASVCENTYKTSFKGSDFLASSKHYGEYLIPVSDLEGNADASKVDSTTTFTTNSSAVTYKQLPTIGDCWFRPTDAGGFALTYGIEREHIVWGKLNDLYINIDSLSINSNSLYQKVGIFITPIIGGNGNPIDFSGTLDFRKQGQATVPWICRTIRKFTNNTYSQPEVSYNGVLYETDGLRGCVGSWYFEHLFTKDNVTKAKNSLKNSQFYLVKEMDIDDLKTKVGSFFKVELDDDALSSLGEDQSALLPSAAFSSSSFVNAKTAISFNGRLHLANYTKPSGSVWGVENVFERDFSEGGRLMCGAPIGAVRDHGGLDNVYSESSPTNELLFEERIKDLNNSGYDNFVCVNKFSNMSTVTDILPFKKDGFTDEDGLYRTKWRNLSMFIPFASLDVNSIDIVKNYRIENKITDTVEEYRSKASLLYDNEMTYYGVKFYFSFNMDHTYTDQRSITKTKDIATELGVVIDTGIVDVPNGILVSGTDTPTYFPDSYVVGSSEIVAMAANAMEVGTGQTGDVPLYVFCKDGIYGLFVDDSGEVAYGTSRILARDVISQEKSVKTIDDGIVFTTDRGLMLISGKTVHEIGQPVEGEWCEFGDSTSPDFDKIANNAYKMDMIARLPVDTQVKEDFLSYVNSPNTLINYNHNERELIVCNKEKDYSFVMDRDGNWSRRSYTADEFVDNFPTSYRVKDGKFYKVDDDPNNENGMFILTRELKLDSIGFKELNRFVARGFFETDVYPIYKTIPAVDKDIQDKYSNKIMTTGRSLNESSPSVASANTIVMEGTVYHSFGAEGVAPTQSHIITEPIGSISAGTYVIDVDDLYKTSKLNIGATFSSDGTPASIGAISLKFAIDKANSNTKFISAGSSTAKLMLNIMDADGNALEGSPVTIKSFTFQKIDDFNIASTISVKETYDVLSNFPKAKYIVPKVLATMSGATLKTIDPYIGNFKAKRSNNIPVSSWSYGRFGTLDEDCYELKYEDDGAGHSYSEDSIVIGESDPFTIDMGKSNLSGYVRDGQAKYNISERYGIPISLHANVPQKFHFTTYDEVYIIVSLYDTDTESIVWESSKICCKVRASNESGTDFDILDFDNQILKSYQNLYDRDTYKFIYRFAGAVVYAVLSPSDIKEGMPDLMFQDEIDHEIVDLVPRECESDPTARVTLQCGFDNVKYDLASHYHKDAYDVVDKYEDSYVGIYVYGSYDARKWTLLGHNEKTGSFNDIGCIVERSDCKFFRFVLAGNLKGTSRLDYFETSSKQSKLSQKIR